MPEEGRSVMDPLGHSVFLPPHFAAAGKDTDAPLDDLVNVVEKPALLLQLSNGDEKLYYLRSIDWHHTLLLEVHYHLDRWEAVQLIDNPGNDLLAGLLRKGKKLL